MRKTIMAVALMALTATAAMAQKADMDKFIDGLMSKMTLEEKLGQLNPLSVGDVSTGSVLNSPVGAEVEKGRCGGILNINGLDKIKAMQEVAVKRTRLHIPPLVGMDVVHGYQTIFPIPLALAASWNPDAAEQCARIAAKEASANGIDWTYSPMVDISLDARWGRIAEGNGEDPFLSACIAKSLVYGYQADMKKNTNIAACLKHYALYGAVESGLDYNFVDMSRIRMFNEYMLPYQAAV